MKILKFRKTPNGYCKQCGVYKEYLKEDMAYVKSFKGRCIDCQYQKVCQRFGLKVWIDENENIEI